ncbi:N-acetylmuramate/N-acetylglucosamine kinase [compost metagenome]
MDAPPPQENCKPFVNIARLLATSGINVPIIHAEDLERGFLLLNDLGNKTYLDVIHADNADCLFNEAITALLSFQQLPMDAPLPSYDVALLRRELELFPEWYVRRHLGIEFNAQQQDAWSRISDLLIDSALAQPKVLVHRDYMPRNLMLSEPNPGVLDFQDAVYGPVTYDITCLFKDAFLSWPQERVQGWLQNYWQRARALSIPVQGDFEAFLQASDLMGVQRHLKVIGIFARICHRDGKPRYLTDVPRFFAYIETVVARRPELSELGELIASLQTPAGVLA